MNTSTDQANLAERPPDCEAPAQRPPTSYTLLVSYLQLYQVEAGQLLQQLSAHDLSLSQVVVPSALTFAQAYQFNSTARWLNLELHGYRGRGDGAAPISELLGVPPQHELVRRVMSYRLIEGQFLVQFGPSSPATPLPVHNLTIQPVSEIEQMAYGAHAALEGQVPLSHLPQHPISVEITARARARGESFIRAAFPRDQFVGLLAGLRREILKMLSACMSGAAAA